VISGSQKLDWCYVGVFTGSLGLVIAYLVWLVERHDPSAFAQLRRAAIPTALLIVPAIVLAVYVFRRDARVSKRQAWLFALALASHTMICLLLALLGQNFDMESFEIVARLADEGKIVYAHTSRYNYGFPWAYVLGVLAKLQRALGMQGLVGLHILVVLVLCLGNIALATLIARVYHPVAGIVFPLLPPGLLITGYQSQFDNLAVGVGVASWVLIRPWERPSVQRWVLSGALLGASLSIKHIFLFFPLCVLVLPRLGPTRHRIAYAAAAYGVFLGQFLPFALDPAAREGIKQNVILYSSVRNGLVLGVVKGVVSMVMPMARKRVTMGLAMAAWLVGMVVFTRPTSAKRPEVMPLLYSIALVAFSPSLGEQYLAIPLAACAVFHRSVFNWCYVIAATLLLVFSRNNIGGPLHLPDSLLWGLGSTDVTSFRGAVCQAILMVSLVLLARCGRSGPLERLVTSPTS
jgi:hypothetical protein